MNKSKIAPEIQDHGLIFLCLLTEKLYMILKNSHTTIGACCQSVIGPIVSPTLKGLVRSDNPTIELPGTTCPRVITRRNDGTIAASPALNPNPLPAPSQCPTSARRNEHNNGWRITNDPARLRGNEDQSVHRRTANDEDMAEPAVDDAQMEQGPWQTVRRHHRRKKNNKISGTLLPGNGGLIGVERIFDLYLGGCATHTSIGDALSHIKDQCNINAECEALQCSSRFFKAFKITVKASEKEKLLSASIWPRGVFINNYFKPRVAQTQVRDN